MKKKTLFEKKKTRAMQRAETEHHHQPMSARARAMMSFGT